MLSIFLLAGTAKAESNVSFHFGLQGGLSMASIPGSEIQNNAGWHAGIAFLLKLPHYFSIQPSAIFSNVNARIAGTGQRYVDNKISVPVAIQWGPDLGFVRPFVQCVPTANFQLRSKQFTDFQEAWQDVKSSMSACRFAMGAGLGLDIWKFQISARYNWNFDRISDTDIAELNGLMLNNVIVSLLFFF